MNHNTKNGLVILALLAIIAFGAFMIVRTFGVVQGEEQSEVANKGVAPQVEGDVPIVQSFAPEGLEFDLEEIRANSAEVAATQAPILVPTPQAVAIAPAAVVAAPAEVAVAQTAHVVAGKTAAWAMTWFKGGDLDRGDGTTFRQDVENLWPDFWLIEPAKWPTPPNVPNPLESRFVVKQGQFGPEVPDGMEIPQGEANYCQVVQGEFCTNPIAARHYMMYTGDGEIPGVWKSVEGMGNTLMIVNVGNVTARYDGAFWQGWRLTGRYWNGDTLPIGVTAMVAHTANVMHNYNSPLNPNAIANAGANCSVPEACEKVHHTVIFVSGNELLLRLDAETFWGPPQG